MSKKPRYNKPTPSVNHSFENYGYGGSGPPQPMPSTPISQHNMAALYQTHPMNAMTTPNSVQAAATTAAPPSPYISSPAMGLPAYNGMGMVNNMGMGMNMGGMGMGMSGMGMPNMGMGMNMGVNMFNGMGFGYSPQMAFQQSAANVGVGANAQIASSPVVGNFAMSQGHYSPAVAAAGELLCLF